MLFEKPSFLIQVGAHGRPITKDMISEGEADGAILSPVDMDKSTNESLADHIRSNEGKVLFDPQWYIPRVDRPSVESYDYFGDHGGDEYNTTDMENPETRKEFLKKVKEVEDDLETDAYIVPSLVLNSFSDANLRVWKKIVEEFIDIVDEEGRKIPVFASLPFSGDRLKKDEQRNKLLNRITSLDVDGFYISPKYDYENSYPLVGYKRVSSLLKMLKSLKEGHNRYEIIMGHSHYVAHLYFGLGINAFASGHYKNVRRMDLRRVDPEHEQGGGSHSYEYYTDHLLADLKLNDLTILDDHGYISNIRMNSPYEEDLFEGQLDDPDEIGWTLRGDSWDHYLWSCYKISRKYRNKDKQERRETTQQVLNSARELFGKMQEDGIILEGVDKRVYAHWSTAFNKVTPDEDTT